MSWCIVFFYFRVWLYSDFFFDFWWSTYVEFVQPGPMRLFDLLRCFSWWGVISSYLLLTTIVSWMRFDRLLVLLWFGFRLLLFVVGSWVWRWVCCIWEWLGRRRVLLLRRCRRCQDISCRVVPWISLRFWRHPEIQWTKLYVSFGSLLRLCFMVAKFNHDFGRRCLWTAWSYAMAACLRVLK